MSTFIRYCSATKLAKRKSSLTLFYIGGGGGKFAPRQCFCYSSKTVGTRLLKLCDFYCKPITHHLVNLLVTRDLSCSHGNPIFNTRLAKNDQNLSQSFLIWSK